MEKLSHRDKHIVDSESAESGYKLIAFLAFAVVLVGIVGCIFLGKLFLELVSLL